jgi:hypothetical protein
MISTRLYLAAAFRCPPADLVPVDEFLKHFATGTPPHDLKAGRNLAGQRKEPPMVPGVNAQPATDHKTAGAHPHPIQA